MLSHGWIVLFLIAGTATALVPANRVNNQESLRSALDALSRMQRSLDTNSQEYYNDLHSFKYHGEPDRKFDRERQSEREADEEDDGIEFLANETPRNLKELLVKAIMSSLEYLPEQELQSMLADRKGDRSTCCKRGTSLKGQNLDNQDSVKMLSEELQDGSPYDPADVDEESRLGTLQMLYDRLRNSRGNKVYENEGPISLGELLNKESDIRGQNRDTDETEPADRDQSVQDQSLLYLSPTERRNVNGRYPMPMDLRTYLNMAKRYPVAKRSPKPLPVKKEITDPKVAQDLGAIFGTQSTDVVNHTHCRDREHDHGHDHNHEHVHEHDHSHDHEHDHEHDHGYESSSEAPKVTALPKGQKESAKKVEKTKTIEVRKKSVDWSQYLGIDRRRKKATFLPRQGTQNQDNEWMLQRYYENMADNLNPNERGYGNEDTDRRVNYEQMESKLKDIDENPFSTTDSENGADLQKLRDQTMARMAAMYSLKKMQKELNNLRSNVAAQMEAKKAAQAQNEQSSSFRENDENSRSEYSKRDDDGKYEIGNTDESVNCQQVENIKAICTRFINELNPDRLLNAECANHPAGKRVMNMKLRVICVLSVLTLGGKAAHATINGKYYPEKNKICMKRYVRDEIAAYQKIYPKSLLNTVAENTTV